MPCEVQAPVNFKMIPVSSTCWIRAEEACLMLQWPIGELLGENAVGMLLQMISDMLQSWERLSGSRGASRVPRMLSRSQLF